jgi:FtsP/CotA-like multicopper oxidase with cupredoxin domain
LRIVRHSLLTGNSSKACLLRLLIPALFALFLFPRATAAQNIDKVNKDVCPRPLIGSMVPEPEDLRSENGELKVALTYTNFRDSLGQMHYCYRDSNGNQAPNLRVHPGDWLTVTLKNDLRTPSNSTPQHHQDTAMQTTGRCANGAMDGLATNLHFHGLSVPPVCHQDDVLNTLVAPSEPAFEYRLQIPPDQPPGVYWYHPHVHGSSNVQVQGGASGALIVEGIERANPLVAGLPERVLIIRDQELMNPDAPPSLMSVMPEMPVLRDTDGDILNTGTGAGKPSKDLSINFVAVPYPDYSPALIIMPPSERQLWRVLNASAITYLDLRVLFNGVPQSLGAVSLDGVPVNYSESNPRNTDDAGEKNRILWQNHIDLPPGGRADFIFKGPPEGVYGNLITHDVDTGPAGENDPVRPLANIIAKAGAAEPRSTLPAFHAPLASQTLPWLGNVKPLRERKLYFSERPSNPNNPNSPTVFMLTVDGQKPVPYDPHSTVASMTVRQGDVEDWIIENRTRELHDFHIHQIHFLVEESDGAPLHEPFLRDTVNINYWRGDGSAYPSVKLRMDFRNPRIVGTFVYHCHLLEHEDGGMMGTIRVEPAGN